MTPIMYFEWRWQSDFGVSILVTTFAIACSEGVACSEGWAKLVNRIATMKPPSLIYDRGRLGRVEIVTLRVGKKTIRVRPMKTPAL